MSGEANLVGAKLGNYLLQKVIGRGHTGVVYLALDEALLRPTAVKVLTHTPADYDPKTWFLSEARSVARLNHSSVVQIYSVARHGAHRYIAMEYVDGASADVVVARQGPFSPERATAVLLQVANALELAHTAGIIHRDVKPANILIKSDGTAKLGDFGMAVSAVRASQDQARAGTPHYFAPEIWRGEPASIASDLYALGATYYHLLSGRPPFTAPTLTELLVAHQRQELAPLTALPPAVAEVCLRLVQRCMARAAADRPRSAQEVAWEARGVLRDLEALARGEPARSGGRELREISLPPADATWQATGFQHEPFAALDAGDPPYRGAPFDVARRRLLSRLAGGDTVLLAGAPGSGRTTLARTALAAWSGPRAFVGLEEGVERTDSLFERVARAFGAVASSATGGAALEELLDLLGPAAASAGRGPLVVVDGIQAGTRAAAELTLLARAARRTHCFALLITGDPALAEPALEEEAEEATIELPPLPMSQVHRYLNAWIAACRHPDAPPLMISVDAALLLGVAASGNLLQLNALARELVLARTAGVLTSWDAWRCTGEVPEAVEGARPASGQWPSQEVLTLLNQVRRVARLAERSAPLAPASD